MSIIVPETLPTIQPEILDKIHQQRHDSRDLIVTIAGYETREELYNWIEFMKEAKETKYLIFCTDSKLYIHLMVAGLEQHAAEIPDDWLLYDQHHFRNTSISFFDPEYPSLSHLRTWILQRLMYTESNILMMDVHTLMIRARTRQYLNKLLQVKKSARIIASLEHPNQMFLNTGLIMMQGQSKTLKRLLANVIHIQQSDHRLTQQDAFNIVLSQYELHLKTGMTMLLDMMHFPNGEHYFCKNIATSSGIVPYIIHANHKYGKGLKDDLKDTKLWKVNEDYLVQVEYRVEMMWRRRQRKNEAEMDGPQAERGAEFEGNDQAEMDGNNQNDVL
ncbi:hypothetical protein BDB01DRAFT_717935 [Pilobolus umbonatus]|nr:hypothetical protein BDB01DRAFT_717935 [Pilobolus umbonatus]